MKREIIFWFGFFILALTMTGGMWMFLENKTLGFFRSAKGKEESEDAEAPGVSEMRNAAIEAEAACVE